MRLFTLERRPRRHSHPGHWFLCIQGEGYFLIDKNGCLEFGTNHVPGVRHNFGNTGKGS